MEEQVVAMDRSMGQEREKKLDFLSARHLFPAC